MGGTMGEISKGENSNFDSLPNHVFTIFSS